MTDEKGRDEQRKSKHPGRPPRLGNFKVTLPGGLAVSGSGVIGLVIASVIVLLGVFLVPKVLAGLRPMPEGVLLAGCVWGLRSEGSRP
jgi:hypothetical protein